MKTLGWYFVKGKEEYGLTLKLFEIDGLIEYLDLISIANK